MTNFGNYASKIIRNIRAANSQAQSTEKAEITNAAELDVADDVTETTTGTAATETGTGTGTSTNGTVTTTSVDSNTNNTPISFSISNFANYLNSPDAKIVTKNGKQYLRYDPPGLGDYYVDVHGNIYHSGLFGMIGDQVNHETWSKQQGPEGRIYQQLYNSIINFQNNGNNGNNGNNQQFTLTIPVVQKTAESVYIPKPSESK